MQQRYNALPGNVSPHKLLAAIAPRLARPVAQSLRGRTQTSRNLPVDKPLAGVSNRWNRSRECWGCFLVFRHGTVPFEDGGRRLAAAFEAVPA